MSANPPYGSNNQDPFDDEFQEDPFIDDHFSKKQQGSQGQAASASVGIAQLPDSNTVLVLGIISIVGAFCYGIVGMIGKEGSLLGLKLRLLGEMGNFDEEG
jgi:hypothetical protein